MAGDTADDVSEGGSGKLGFLDSLGRLFGAKPKRAPAPGSDAASGFEKLEADFGAALRALDTRIAEQKRSAREESSSGTEPTGLTAEEREARRLRRMDEAHRAIREDIEKMHARLGTGISGTDLSAISAFLRELSEVSVAGADSHDLLPRARYAIAERMRAESGELAVARTIALLGQQKRDWPDPTQYSPTATPEEVERSRRRRLGEVREAFLALDLGRLAEVVEGIVRGWGGDYPDRGSPLWEETVLRSVTAGVRGRLIQDFVEVLRRGREQLLASTEGAVGKELASLQSALAGGVHSIEQANQAITSSLRVLDEVVPEIAWKAVCAELPQARGEASA